MGAKWWSPGGPKVDPNERRSTDRDPSADRAYTAFRLIQIGAALRPWHKQDEFTVQRAKNILRGKG